MTVSVSRRVDGSVDGRQKLAMGVAAAHDTHVLARTERTTQEDVCLLSP